MSLQARLTLWSVVVMAIIVGVVSGLDLTHEINNQFLSTLERAEHTKRLSVDTVRRSLNANRSLTVGEVLTKDSLLSDHLLDIMTSSQTLVEIAVCDANNEILIDTDPSRLGSKYVPYSNFRELVRNAGWFHQMMALRSPKNYELSEALGVPGQTKPLVTVHVVVYPTLVSVNVMPVIRSHADLAVASLVGAILAAFVLSVIAFRPLGKLGKMLDQLASGEYDNSAVLAQGRAAADEFGVVASKVNLLGQQLRGVRYDFSDLRGNFEKLLEELEDAVLIFGRDRRLVVAAGAVDKFLRKQRSELLGKMLVEVFPPTTTIGLFVAQAAQTGRPIHSRSVPISYNGDGSSKTLIALLSLDILETFSANSGPGPTTALMVRLRDPEATRQIGRQLQTADRLSAISRITGGVAHEVKNPLNAILMHVELAKMKLAKGDHDLEPQMEIITNEIVRLDRVVKTFLDFTRPVELNLTDVPLEAFVNDIVELARPLAETSGIEVSVQQQTEGVSISADIDLLKQAILNIVVNAIEAMPEGGTLRFQSSVRGDEADIRISDTGPGIPADLKEKIFALYFTTKEKGSGIGLAMTFRIVQLHDGTINFTSEPGKGTTFVLRFPTAASSA